jgi:hypothetical protein
MAGAYSSRKEVRDIIRQVEAQGWTTDNTRKGHVRIYDKSGEFVTMMSGTPGKSGMSATKDLLRRRRLTIK